MENRRNRSDRRQRDYGPPSGCCERRKHAERRLPVAEEAELSDADFAALFGSVAKLGNADYQLDAAARVFDKINER